MRRLAPLLLILIIALAPVLAGARPGGGMSFGSRGGHTWSSAPGTSISPSGGAPMQRSMTPNNGSGFGGSSYGGQSYGGQSYGGQSYGGQAYGGGYGMRPRSAFTSGLMGGLIGAGVGGMLFGHGFFGGMSGGGSLIGLLLQLFLLYMLGSWVYRRFFAGNMAVAGGGGMFARTGHQGTGHQGTGNQGTGNQAAAQASLRQGGMFGSGRQGRQLALTQADYAAFDQLLHAIQAAWSAHDLNGLRTMATPEMASFFAEQLAEQTSRGVRNSVTDVRLQKGDLSEAWSEGSREYATVAMRFSMLDVTKDAAGRVVDGSLNEHQTVSEIWTFLRAPAGRWVLSAIQQPR